jgi:polyisoprenoid-binding protein YceI
VKGRFKSMEGNLHIDEIEPAASWIEASIDVASIDTGEPQRDEHLKSDDFFNADLFPRLTFRSTRVEKIDGEHWRVVGDLTIRETTKEVVLDTEFEGRIKDAFGKDRAAFSAETTLNRKEFGLNWNGLIEAGGVVVGDKVRVTLNIAAVRAE